jgi:hypothetical protein
LSIETNLGEQSTYSSRTSAGRQFFRQYGTSAELAQCVVDQGSRRSRGGNWLRRKTAMCDEGHESALDALQALPSRRDVLIAGAALVTAPLKGQRYIVVATGAANLAAELIALRLT